MHIIRIDKTESTNVALKSLHQEKVFKKPVCLVTDTQTAGRGQKGASWQSEPYKNLTFSILFPQINTEIQHQFKLNMLVSLSLLEFLKSLNIPNLALKWPNDIMAGQHKVGGILIENAVANGLLKSSIIGIGLNVNQVEFEGLPRASSLKLKTSKNFDLKSLLEVLLIGFSNFLEHLKTQSFNNVKTDYEGHLFKKDSVSAFKLKDGRILNGIIKGINKNGQLLVETDEGLSTFSLKELRLLF